MLRVGCLGVALQELCTCEHQVLLETQLVHAGEGQVHILQGEGVKVAAVGAGPVLVDHEHLTHLVDGQRSVDGGLQGTGHFLHYATWLTSGF